MVMEAVCAKVRQEDRDAEKEQEKKEWRKDLSELEQYR